MVGHTYNLSYLGDWGGRIRWIQEAEAAVSQDRVTALLGDRVRPLSQKDPPNIIVSSCFRDADLPECSYSLCVSESVKTDKLRTKSILFTILLLKSSVVLANISQPKNTYWKLLLGRAWWFTPVIPTLWEDKVDGSLEVRSSGPARPT